MCLKPLESSANEGDCPTLPAESTIPEEIAPPLLIGVADGDMVVLLVRTNQSGE